MQVQSLHTYPVKACYRLDHERVQVEPWGFQGDRRWMVVDAETGKVVTQRERPGLTQVRPATVPAGLVLRTTGMPDLVVPEPVAGEHLEVSVWSFTGAAASAGPIADDWLSEALGRKVRLVWLDDPRRRAVNPQYAEPGDTVSFADGYPVLLANVASLAALNDWIVEGDGGEDPLPMTRFRPNVVIAGAPAWIEDGWVGGRVRIGELTFRVAKPCPRCVVTTTDQETGEKGREPLRALARHRNVDQDLNFAINLIPDGPGTLSLADVVRPG